MMGMISASSSCAFLISFGLSPSGMTLVQLTSTVSFVILTITFLAIITRSSRQCICMPNAVSFYMHYLEFVWCKSFQPSC
ncbi:E3 ubiquitin-protein ligase hrd-like protein 1 [Frankliniella fusca]|uniref:E3 ubiquitin-protein ligase hrd-like protein 1 n=1 Tax=Frankliniella fusca TaxID=407009 RepID=A0AAE1IYE8_9NEOP|nr:E3 ubiquitin-protein ligase hrd-like protein 1 [Frankliniella fusca]KAK3933226.1 E3 ubiquitin-protein ligase hrd-like protein 1 [Frankliniella fusca]